MNPANLPRTQHDPLRQVQRQIEELRAIAVRMETRLCALIEHLGADTKIQSLNKK